MERALVRGQLLHLDDGAYEVVRGVGASVLLRHVDDRTEVLLGLEDVPLVLGEALMLRDARFDPALLSALSPADRMLVHSKRYAVEAVLGLLPSDDRQFATYDPHTTTIGERINSQVIARRAANLPVSPNTLRNWKKKFLAGGALALRDMRSARTKSPFGDTDKRILVIIDEVLAEYSSKSDVTDTLKINQVRKRVRARYAEDQEPPALPSDRTLRRRLHDRLDYARTHGTARQRQIQANVPDRMFFRRPVYFPGQEGQADTSPFDLLYADRNGKARRAKLTVLFDVGTRVPPDFVVTDGPPTGTDHAFLLLSSLTTSRVAAGPVLPWTVDLSAFEWADGWCPERIREAVEQQPFISTTRWHSDNARDFQSHVLQSMADTLGVDISYANPATPTDKPEVERNFRSFWDLLLEELPGYISSSTEHRGEEPDPTELLDIYTLTAVLRAWIAVRWNNRPHPGLRDPVMPGVVLTPNQMYDVMFDHTGAVPFALSEAEFVRLLPTKRRKCRSIGFTIDYRRYDAELIDFRGEPCPYTQDGLWPIYYLQSNPTVAWVDAPDGTLITLNWMNRDFFLQPYNKHVRAGARQIAARAGVERDPQAVENIARLISATNTVIEHSEREQDRADTNAALSDQLGLNIPRPRASDGSVGRDRGSSPAASRGQPGTDALESAREPVSRGRTRSRAASDGPVGIFDPFEEDL